MCKDILTYQYTVNPLYTNVSFWIIPTKIINCRPYHKYDVVVVSIHYTIKIKLSLSQLRLKSKSIKIKLSRGLNSLHNYDTYGLWL